MVDKLRGRRLDLEPDFHLLQEVHRAKSEIIHLEDDAGAITVSDITDLTATAGELNTLDGITATVDELNLLDLSGLTAGDLLIATGASTASWQTPPNEVQSWPFDSPAGSTGDFYFGGFYQFHSSAFTPAGGTNVGSTLSPYAAHAIVVLGAASTDMVVRVTGTSINDSGTRTTSDFEDIDTSGGSTDDYYETDKKFIGQVSYTLQSGTGVTINAGFSKYWDYGNSDFTVKGLEALWLAGANDAGANIELLHHKLTGWTYGAGGAPTPPTPIAAMATDHSTEREVENGEFGAWKRVNLDTDISGSACEGILWRVTTTANKAFELGNLEVSFVAT